MKIAIVGATGLVGSEMNKVLYERGFAQEELIMAASPKSIGKPIEIGGKNYTVVSVEEAIKAKPDIAIFSAGGKVSLEYAPQFASAGSVVIDNSSAWRMKEEIPLIVPEINGYLLTEKDKIIANPNCSTIQMVMALAPLHKRYTIKRIVVSTYQSVTGTGVKAVNQLFGERSGENVEKAYPYPIDLNVIPHGGTFEENGYTSEEMKLVHETRKILQSKEIQVTATVVRVPVTGGHSEAVNVEFENEYKLEDIFSLLNNMSGIKVLDDPLHNIYPMPIISKGCDDVFVGRIRRDESQAKTLNFWVVSDNLRKGAATNAVQIAEYLIGHHLLKRN